MLNNNLPFEQYEKIFFNYIINYRFDLLLSVDERVFINENIKKIYGLCRNYYKKYNKILKKTEIKLIKNNFKNFKDLDDDIIDIIYNIDLSEYDLSWLDNILIKWIRWRVFENNLIEGIEMLKNKEFDIEKVDNYITLFNNKINSNLLVSENNLGIDIYDINSFKINERRQISSTYRFMDYLTNGGYDRNNLILYIGETNIGKSIWLCNKALNYVKLGYNVVYITLEMSEYQVLKRIFSNWFNIKMNNFDDIVKNNSEYIKNLIVFNRGNNINNYGNLFIKQFSTGTTRPVDIESYILNLERCRNIKIDVVIIDYINLMDSNKNISIENTYIKIKNISEVLRGMSIQNDYLIVTASQINRNKIDSSEIGIKDISESLGLVHTADYVYAIIQDTKMHAEQYYFLKVLKARNGSGKFIKCRFDINYEYMRLTETDNIY